eukprot:357702-Chlamydomonas_euryale.AAC.1
MSVRNTPAAVRLPHPHTHPHQQARPDGAARAWTGALGWRWPRARCACCPQQRGAACIERGVASIERGVASIERCCLTDSAVPKNTAGSSNSKAAATARRQQQPRGHTIEAPAPARQQHQPRRQQQPDKTSNSRQAAAHLNNPPRARPPPERHLPPPPHSPQIKNHLNMSRPDSARATTARRSAMRLCSSSACTEQRATAAA